MEVRNKTTFAFGPIMGRVNFPSHTGTLVVKAGFKLTPGGVCEPMDEQPPFEGDVMSQAQTPECLYDADLAYFKPKADVLLTGYAYQPGGKAGATCTVSFGVGEWSKSIACIGNRTWEKGLIRSSMGEPEEFTRVELTWANAFGGPKFKDNPAGKGRKDSLLPNLEDPDDLIGGAGDKPKPACFGPVHRTWKLRTKKMGSFDKKWLKERWPAFPENFDWTHFNAAPEDQQLEGYLRGDEEITLKNMSREHAELKSKLPGVRARVLLREDDDQTPSRGSQTVREVPMNLDTLFVNAEKGEVYLTWRGVANVSDEDWLECNDILIVQDKLGHERSEEELLPLFDEEPDEEDLEDAEEIETPEQRQAKADALMKEIESAEAQADQYEAQVKSQMKQAMPDDYDLDGAIAQAKNADPNAAAKAFEAAAGAFAGEQLGLPAGVKASDFNPMLDPDMQELMNMKRAAKPPLPSETNKVLSLMKSGEAGGGDFSKTDLNGQDLSGADLTDTYLNKANLEGADLSGAKLVYGSLIDANLKDANLSNADLTDADLTGADLTGANLEGAKLVDVVAANAKLNGANLNGVDATGASFLEVEAGAATFNGANLEEVVFSDSALEDANFSDANLSGADFSAVKAVGAKFDRANLANFRGGDESDFSQASFVEAAAPASVWEKSKLVEADFHMANLTEAQFPFADLTDARLLEANLSGCLMHKTILKDAKAGNANFFKALLEKADFTGASLVGSNFYEADFFEAVTDDADFTGANLKMTKLSK